MSRIAPSYDEVLDALCAAIPHMNRDTYDADQTLWKCIDVATRAGRQIAPPEMGDSPYFIEA